MSSPNKSPGLVRLNFDPPQTLMLISGIGPKLARIIVQLRQESGNLDLDTLEVLIRRSLSVKELDQLDFTENPMLAAASQASGNDDDYIDWEPLSRSRAPEPMFESTPYLNQDQMKAELASQISDLEAEITRWEEFPGIWSDFLPQFAKPLSPKRLLFQPDPVVVTGMPISSDVASSVPAPHQSLGLPQMRAGRAIKRPRQSSLCCSVTSEASSMAPSANSPNSPWRATDYNVPAQFRETSAENLGHFQAPRSPPAPIMRPCPTHFTMPSNQPVTSGISLPSNQPVVSGVSLYNSQPVASGVSLPSNQPVVSGFSMPNNLTVVSSVPVQSTLPVVGNLIAASNLPIDWCSNWLLFKRKFERYARMQDWSDEECGDCLGWCLTGKAVDFYALLTEGRETLPYAELMQRLQERFGARELPATAQGRF
ncbi:hypothetical protein DPMN_011612 [Dreissena polymorpha]|uniref:Uncharacterized protein n=1 Tax=Dreissena polymorpha TaxID=45954 RepID=A0A9D4S069_DREPO|nr:hypothetical protein DPMN_011612 [Dreissena polymorpha]